jgi:hypothetical protein
MGEPYQVLDPRPVAASAPYTYFLPDPELVKAVGVGDLVKGVFRSAPPSETYDAERMWVKVTSVQNDWLEGVLDSDPRDMPNLPAGSVVRLPRTHVIDFVFSDADKAPFSSRQPRREYWERCLVDKSVINGEVKVGYIYREEPDMAKEGDRFPDSGWRIRGDTRGKSTQELASGEIAYVAVGVVLNKDDTWLHLIDEPIGAAFEKDFERCVFVSST